MSTYRFPNIDNRPPQIVDTGFYGRVMFDPDDDLPDYIGMHVTATASTALTDWKVMMFYYNAASTNVVEIRTAYGTWAGRAALFT